MRYAAQRNGDTRVLRNWRVSSREKWHATQTSIRVGSVTGYNNSENNATRVRVPVSVALRYVGDG